MLKGNLLIVDDEVDLINDLKQFLIDHADNIYVAQNGFEALKVLETYKINCILCDINMPKMNGVELIKKIRAAKNDVPFIFYTGHGNNTLMMEAVKYGAFDFLDKPNLTGVEEVVVRGLKEGLGGQDTKAPSDDDFMSDYRKMLDQIEKKK